MNPEMMTIVQNIQSLIDQLKQMESGGGWEDEAEKAKDDKEMINPEDVAKILKELEGSKEDEKEDEEEIKKSDNGPTASDSAEERLETSGDVNEENVQDVAKTIIKYLRKAKEVKKSKSDDSTKVLKALVDEIKEIKKCQENILGGLGIAEKIKKDYDAKVEKSESRRQVENNPLEIQKTLDFIAQHLNNSTRNESVINPGQSFQKSLAENNGALLHGLFVNNKK